MEDIYESRILIYLKNAARVTPREYKTIGAWAGVSNDRVRPILQRFKRQGLVKFVPLKKCPTCKRQLTTGSGWLYIGGRK